MTQTINEMKHTKRILLINGTEKNFSQFFY